MDSSSRWPSSSVMMSVFFVDERELAVKFRFGEIIVCGFRAGIARQDSDRQ